MINIIKKILFIFSIITFFGGCADHIIESAPSIDEQNNEDLLASTFSEIQTNVFNKSCALGACHGGVVMPDLSANSYSRIVNKPSSMGMDYVEPNDPNNSYLFLKITGDSSISGERMPRNSSALSQSTIDSIRKWIENGAQNN